jgi:hypothetical protein
VESAIEHGCLILRRVLQLVIWDGARCRKIEILVLAHLVVVLRLGGLGGGPGESLGR